ncbi:class I SAM-dependent methyltransferase [Limobrevibacterium gyesilva]|uniref:Class I SAM-dependent methyltransferase n=1 Tax=Limobrevibacterium gyesilva TaxID=2991712 RepID=A0AA41YJR9_9PROT|nr:class I SAM-dependent methyltransferase [Limobrevibacterium gyesilva]MCW3475034.1 class I SAM-dependent methyltransferase [Limobrevibacterium gyesilva]
MTDALAAYVAERGTRESDAQRGLRAATRGRPGAGMQIGPDQGQFMAFLVQLTGARRALEIGVFTGYSALSVAAALPEGGELVACDISEDYTSVGRPFWRQAGVDRRIDLRLGPALATLDGLLADGQDGTFDFAFIDADKTGYDAYYERCLVLVRRGGLIAIDNVLWGGAVIDPADTSPDTEALRALNRKIHADARVDMCLLPIGDGLTLVRRR